MNTPTQVMGILNITADSFFDGGKYQSLSRAACHIERMLNEGAHIIDVGASSTRPGSVALSSKDEIKTLHPILKLLRTLHPSTRLSIDTFHAEVAQWALQEFGVEIINDISGGTLDHKMFDCIAQHHCTYIMMHMRGTPATMQNETHYDDIIQEIMVFFAKQKKRLRELGVKNIIIDPGFGFAKTTEQNYELLRKLNLFDLLELPIMVGISRKSMIQKVLHCTAEESLNGTTVVHTLALLNGANILRVHDVKEAVECINIIKHYETTN